MAATSGTRGASRRASWRGPASSRARRAPPRGGGFAAVMTPDARVDRPLAHPVRSAGQGDWWPDVVGTVPTRPRPGVTPLPGFALPGVGADSRAVAVAERC